MNKSKIFRFKLSDETTLINDLYFLKNGKIIEFNNKLKQVYDMKRTKDNKIITVNKFSNENKYIDNTKICERMFSLHL